MLPLPTIPSQHEDSVPAHEDDLRFLEDRMRKPQRHRLLHGYPLAAALPRRAPDHPVRDVVFDFERSRSLLIGVLPHPFCNPAVTGCGFCTFPHEAYRGPDAVAVVEHVLQEIEQRVSRQPGLLGRRVTGLYFGGGTANLTPAESFRRLCRRLADTFDLSQAEITLEGVPAYFLKRQPWLVDILLEEIPARHFRLSMGIQTFDEGQLQRMGRQAFGNPMTFQQVVELGHRLGCTVSADLLFNLPGQSLAEMRQDVARAESIGLDHLGLYHLVVFRGLGTAWSRDPSVLASVPANEQAVENWLSLRDLLRGQGFDQTTLTNFERVEFRGQDRRFLYEECSFRPDRFDVLGFGPSAISFASRKGFATALKVVNPDGSADYLTGVARGLPAWDRWFDYGPRDLRIFFLTRRLAALSIDRSAYRRLFGSDPVADFPTEFAALTARGLVEVRQEAILPTPRGMFYSDSIASLLAWRQIRLFRSGGFAVDRSTRFQPEENPSDEAVHGNARGHM